MTDSATDERLKLAEALLQEAVYRSRTAQADPLGAEGSGEDAASANCGLGRKAAVVLDLSPRGEELLAELWPDPPADAAMGDLRAVVADWVRRQDALDRKRNHFLKDFRHRHGLDRGAYDDEQAAAYRAGLDAINAEADEARRAAAESLLDSPDR